MSVSLCVRWVLYTQVAGEAPAAQRGWAPRPRSSARAAPGPALKACSGADAGASTHSRLAC